MTTLDLNSIRQKIDTIDEQLLKLFNKRAKCAIQVAESKKQSLKEGETLEFFRPDREAQVRSNAAFIAQMPRPSLPWQTAQVGISRWIFKLKPATTRENENITPTTCLNKSIIIS